MWRQVIIGNGFTGDFISPAGFGGVWVQLRRLAGLGGSSSHWPATPCSYIFKGEWPLSSRVPYRLLVKPISAGGLGTEYGPKKASFASCSKNRPAQASLLIPVSIKKGRFSREVQSSKAGRAEIVETIEGQKQGN